MVILQKTAAVGSIPSQAYKPITTQSEAISTQKTVLSSVVPTSDAEAAAVKTQQNLLENYQVLEKQQAVVNTAYVTSSSQMLAPSTYNNAAISQENKEAQIKALATDENREKLLSAVKYGVDMWRLQAHFSNISIMGQIALGNPGCLTGPELKPWIMQAPGVYNATGYFKTLITAVADAVVSNFRQWQDSVTVPGLPWYPMFAAFPGPFAPPMPNIPMPLIVCVSQNQNKLMSPSQIESAIKTALPAEFLLADMDLFYFPLSVHIANHFTNWLCSQQVMMVMGMGPVPTFNPPYVPVGAVINGYIIPSPGHLAV
jgi:hypothetical protein